eukprot:1384104-Amorphochlora_amoeboformis.AAC.1
MSLSRVVCSFQHSSPCVFLDTGGAGECRAMSAAWQKKKKNVVNMSRLHLAAATGSVQELDELISMKMDVNALSGEGTNGRQTPLMLAARNGHLEPVIKLLRSGARLETQDCYGQTALLRAVRGGQVAVVRVILENKANIDHQVDVSLQ